MDNDALERLELRVESKEGSEPTVRRELRERSEGTPRAWATRAAPQKPWFRLPSFSPLEYLFAFSIIFFIGAGTLASLLIFSGSNTVSTKNVDVSVSGPTSIRAGDEVTLQVVITNRNAVPMNLTDLLVEFPIGTRSTRDVSVDLPRLRESLGTIAPGASVNRTIKAVMFGQAGTALSVSVTAEYRVPSSNAVFQSSSDYRTTISQSPATVTVESLSEVVSGQPTEFTVTVGSNASDALTGMLLVATYPPGFAFESSKPAPYSGSSVWDLGDIESKGTRTVTVRGTFTGEDGDDRVIHFTAGTKNKKDAAAISAPLATTDATLKVAKPFVSVVLKVNGNTAPVVSANRGDIVEVEVEWANNLPVRVQNLEIAVKLGGSIVNRGSVRTGQGFYRSSDSTILFSKETDPRLAAIEPGMSGVSTFEFATMLPGQGTFQSPQVTLGATVKANRSSEGGVIDTVTSSAQATVQLATDLTLTPLLARASGPVPPKVDTPTTYTVTWQLQNSANAIANTQVTALLPAYVTWKGSSTDGVTYNDTDRTVTWVVGDVAASASRSASFQITFTPSVTQVNGAPPLIMSQKVSAFDRFIRAQVDRPVPNVTTQTNTSPQNGIVVP